MGFPWHFLPLYSGKAGLKSKSMSYTSMNAFQDLLYAWLHIGYAFGTLPSNVSCFLKGTSQQTENLHINYHKNTMKICSVFKNHVLITSYYHPKIRNTDIGQMSVAN